MALARDNSLKCVCRSLAFCAVSCWVWATGSDSESRSFCNEGLTMTSKFLEELFSTCFSYQVLFATFQIVDCQSSFPF